MFKIEFSILKMLCKNQSNMLPIIFLYLKQIYCTSNTSSGRALGTGCLKPGNPGFVLIGL